MSESGKGLERIIARWGRQSPHLYIRNENYEKCKGQRTFDQHIASWRLASWQTSVGTGFAGGRWWRVHWRTWHIQTINCTFQNCKICEVETWSSPRHRCAGPSCWRGRGRVPKVHFSLRTQGPRLCCRAEDNPGTWSECVRMFVLENWKFSSLRTWQQGPLHCDHSSRRVQPQQGSKLNSCLRRARLCGLTLCFAPDSLKSNTCVKYIHGKFLFRR